LTEKDLDLSNVPGNGSAAHPANLAAQIASGYRYVPVLALNSAPGIRAAFSYTYDKSTAKQTMTGAAVSVNVGQTGFGAFSVGSSTTESTDRQFQRAVYASGAYHKIIWVDYASRVQDAAACVTPRCR
jgi:hypothetical protein